MDSMPIEAPKISKATWGQRFFTVCFLTASAVAMLGWSAGIIWVAYSLLGLIL
jgi:hypothetical protein